MYAGISLWQIYSNIYVYMQVFDDHNQFTQYCSIGWHQHSRRALVTSLLWLLRFSSRFPLVPAYVITLRK